MKKFLFRLVLFLVFFIVLGLLREYIFVNINNIIYYKYYKNTTLSIPFGFGWLIKFSYTTLYYLKYPLTVLFVLIYYYLNYSFLKQLSVKVFYIKTLSLSYAFIFFVSAVLMLYAYFTHHQLNADEYFISRGLMGLAQSPLISFVLFALYLWDKNYYHEKRHSGI